VRAAAEGSEGEGRAEEEEVRRRGGFLREREAVRMLLRSYEDCEAYLCLSHAVAAEEMLPTDDEEEEVAER
jgi:hypothetical protein